MWRHRDSNVITEIRAETYPYGAELPEHGIQITLERDQIPVDPRLLTLRLPRPAAVALAWWILQGYPEDQT